MSEIELLRQLQACDTTHMRLQRELDELDEAKQIMQCRAKRKDLKAKQDQVIELADDAAAKLEKLQREEEQVIAKIKALQEKLDTTSDYRVTQSVTKDMQGQCKRQEGIAEEQNEVLERQIKIDQLAGQVADMLAKVDRTEEQLTQSFKRKGGKIKAAMDEQAVQRAELVAQLPAGLARAYEAKRAEKGGIALAELDGERCTVCSTTLPVAQLEKLRKGPALAECPNCHRLMVAHEPED